MRNSFLGQEDEFKGAAPEGAARILQILDHNF